MQNEDRLINNVDTRIQTVSAMTSRTTEGGGGRDRTLVQNFEKGEKISEASAIIDPYLLQLQM